MIKLLFDNKLKKPGCVILQVMAGCAHNNTFMQMTFTDWLVNPTPDMKIYEATEDQWREIARKAKNI